MILKDGTSEQAFYFLEMFLNVNSEKKLIKLSNNQEKILWVIAKFIEITLKNEGKNYSRIAYLGIAKAAGVSFRTVIRCMKFFYDNGIVKNLNRSTRSIPFLIFGEFAQNTFIEYRKSKIKKVSSKQIVRTNWCQNGTLVTKLEKLRSTIPIDGLYPKRRERPDTYFKADQLKNETLEKEKEVSEKTEVPIRELRRIIYEWSVKSGICLKFWDTPYLNFLEKRYKPLVFTNEKPINYEHVVSNKRTENNFVPATRGNSISPLLQWGLDNMIGKN